MNIPIEAVTDKEFIVSIQQNKNDNSPLTASITSSSKYEHSLKIIIKGKYDNDLSYHDIQLSRSHEIPLIGLYPNYKNTVYVQACNSNDQKIASRELEIRTDSIQVPIPEIEIFHYDRERLDGRLSFVEFRIGINNVPFIFDEYGDVRWYLKYPDQSLVRPTVVQNAFDFYCGDYGYEVMYRYDWTGNVDTIDLPPGFKMLHHDVFRYEDRIFFPADENFILECDQEGRKIKAWDLEEIVRGYLPVSQELILEDEDWLHLNSVYYEPGDHSLVISARQSLGVFKIDYDSGNIRWILNDTCLAWYSYPQLKQLALQPEGNCELPLGQHSPVALSNNRILMLDNGYDGYERLNNEDGLIAGGKSYSRLVVYEIDEGNGTVEQNFEYGREQQELYSRFAGNCGHDPLTGSYYGLWGNITTGKNSPLKGRVIEVDQNGHVLFDAGVTALKPMQMFFRGKKINLNDVINN